MRKIVLPAVLVALGFAAAWIVLPDAAGSAAPAEPNKTGLVSLDKAEVVDQPWGKLIKAFTGETYGVKDLLTAYLTLEPGEWPHPPHVHAEEEFMIVTEGSGVWHLNGREIPARKGDVVYTAPWDSHGVKNTGSAPLTIFVVKWGYKGLKDPEKPGSR